QVRTGPYLAQPVFQELLKRQRDDSANQRPHEGADAAQNGDKGDVDRDGDVEYRGRLDVQHVLRHERATDGRKPCTDKKGRQLVPAKVDARRLGGVFVVAQRAQIVA